MGGTWIFPGMSASWPAEGGISLVEFPRKSATATVTTRGASPNYVVFLCGGSQKKLDLYTQEFSEDFVDGDEFGGPFGARIVSHSMPQLRAFEHLQGVRCV